MVINFDKTKVMFITTRQKREQMADKALHIYLNDQVLDQVTSDKILGVFVDNNLLWHNHVNALTKKISRNTWLLSQSKYLPLSHRLMFYKSFIQPHIDYCNVVWASASKTKLNKIERLKTGM